MRNEEKRLMRTPGLFSRKVFVWGSLMILIALSIVVVGMTQGWIPVVPFDKTKYVTVLGFAASVLSSAFALIAGTATLLVQQIAGNSPKSLKFFPQKEIIGFLVFVLALLVADGVWFLGSPDKVDLTINYWVVFGNALFYAHVIAGVGVILYVGAVFVWLRYETLIDTLAAEASRCTTANQLGPVIQSFDELASSIIQKRYPATVSYLLNTCSDILGAWSRSQGVRAEDTGAENPTYLLLDFAARLTKQVVRNQMSTVAYTAGNVFRDFLAWAARMSPGIPQDHPVVVEIKDVFLECLAHPDSLVAQNFLFGLHHGVTEAQHLNITGLCLAELLELEVTENVSQRLGTIQYTIVRLQRLVEKSGNPAAVAGYSLEVLNRLKINGGFPFDREVSGRLKELEDVLQSAFNRVAAGKSPSP